MNRLQQGVQIGARYTLGQRIAVGGMGEVWSGTDDVLGRPVAVKALRQDLSNDRAFQVRFREEARTAGGLSHGGIAAVYDYGEEGPLSYLVMELVEGEPLSVMLARSGALDVDLTLDLMGQTARALHAAHRSGVVHRDVKPANLLITPDLRVKVTDFGIARPRDHEPLTATGQVMGTAHYLAPELARGEVASPLSDVYALGIVLYECLAGRRPFEGDNQIAVATAQLTDPPPPLPASIPIPVRRVTESALAKRPADRPSGAHAFAVLLEDLHRARTAARSEGPAETLAGALAGGQHPGAQHPRAQRSAARGGARPEVRRRSDRSRAGDRSRETGRSTAGVPAAAEVLPPGELPQVAPTGLGVLGGPPAPPHPVLPAYPGMGTPSLGHSPHPPRAGAGAGTDGAPFGPGSGPLSRAEARRLERTGDRGSAPWRDPRGPDTAVLPLIGSAGRGWRERWGGRRLTMPLIVAGVVALVAVLGVAWSREGRADSAGSAPTRTPAATETTGATPSGGPGGLTPTGASTNATPTDPAPTSTTTTARTVLVRPRDYLGKDVDLVRAALTRQGLDVEVTLVNRKRGPQGRVVGIEPSGPVVQGSTVTLKVSDRKGDG